MCDSCTHDKCTSCKSDYLVLSPDEKECWNKLTGCEIALKDQTFDFFKTNENKAGYRESGFYSCPQCLPGYYWKSNTFTTTGADGKLVINKRQGECTKCGFHGTDMKMCDSCTGPSQCSSCRAPFILLPNRNGCAALIKDCAVDVSEYVAQTDEEGRTTWRCPQCKGGMFTREDGTCSDCSEEFEGCAHCDGQRCLSCEEPDQIPSYDG